MDGTEDVGQGSSREADTDTVWEGERKSLTAAATGGRMVTARYRMTREYVYFEAGLLGSKSEQVPLWAVRDVDVKQSLTQKTRGVGDVVVRVQHDDYTGRSEVSLESIQDPRSVRDLINSHAQTARLEYQRRQQTHIYEGRPPCWSGPSERAVDREILDSAIGDNRPRHSA